MHPSGGAHSAPPDPLAKGSYWEGKGRRVFSVYLNICGLRKGPGKIILGVLENFLGTKRVGTLDIVW